MMRHKYDLIVCLTTFHHEFLKLSVSGLRGINKKTLLIIHNDNPCKKLTKKHVRKLGYHGKLIIINNPDNLGLLQTRIAAIEHIKTHKISSKWIMFANDDDIILNTKVIDIADSTFAIMGNSVVISSNLLDILRLMENAQDYTIDNADNFLKAPNIGMAGTFIKFDIMLDYAEFLKHITEKLQETISNTHFVPPIDLIMWHILVEYMRVNYPAMSPIYMNQTNYLMTKLNGTLHATDSQIQAMLERVMSIVDAALWGNE